MCLSNKVHSKWCGLHLLKVNLANGAYKQVYLIKWPVIVNTFLVQRIYLWAQKSK